MKFESKKLMGLGLMGLMLATAQGSDLTKGYTFSSGEQNVTHTKLNNLVDLASINTSFLHGQSALNPATLSSLDEFLVYSAGSAAYRKVTIGGLFLSNTNLITGQTEDTAPAPNDFMLTYDASAGTLKQVSRLNFINYVWPTILDLHGGLTGYSDINAGDEFWTYSANHSGSRKLNYADLSAAIVALVPAAGGVTNNSDLVRTDSHYTTGTYTTPSDVTITTGKPIDTAHSLGAAPQFIRLVLVAQGSPDAGYTAGDEIDASSVDDLNGLTAFQVGASSANVFALCRTTSFYVLHKSTGSHTAATSGNWKLKIYASRLH